MSNCTRHIIVCALTLLLSSCGNRDAEKPKPSPQATPEQPATPAKSKAANPPPIQPGEVLDAEKMKKLQEDRKDLIKRGTPTGEEEDAVGKLRNE